jgi:hypothetical protein
MLLQLSGRVLGAVVLLASVGGLSRIEDSSVRVWIHPIDGPRGPVRILRFYANAGSIAPGDRARLCYGVENAKSVRISPSVATVLPVANQCLDIVPEHTTHYTILAEGYDGKIATRFLTLIVQTEPRQRGERVNMAVARQTDSRPLL